MQSIRRCPRCEDSTTANSEPSLERVGKRWPVVDPGCVGCTGAPGAEALVACWKSTSPVFTGGLSHCELCVNGP